MDETKKNENRSDKATAKRKTRARRGAAAPKSTPLSFADTAAPAAASDGGGNSEKTTAAAHSGAFKPLRANIAAIWQRLRKWWDGVNIHIAAYVTVAIFTMELILRLMTVKTFFGIGLFYTALFDVAIIALILVAGSLFKNERTNRYVVAAILTLIGVYFGIQLVYFNVFSVYFTLYSLGGAGQVLQFWRVALAAILKCLIPLIIVLGFGVGLFFIKKQVYTPHAGKLSRLIFIVAAVGFHVLALVLVTTDTRDAISISYVYQYTYVPESSVQNFGMLTTLRLDLKYQFTEVKPVPANSAASLYADRTPQEIGVGYNVISSIDFSALAQSETNPTIADMHNYFSTIEPTNQNEFTGYFEGNNLILIVAEGFSGFIIDEELTPTLYRMYNEGFQFTDFYLPIWFVSTLDGEYVTCNSLIPKSGDWSFATAANDYMPFCLGNQARGVGYHTYAYHDHTYTYYNRQYSHPNMGYDYKGYGNGLDVTWQWPESDVEMMEKSIDEYIDQQPFHIYYLTVSGHLEYNFGGNAMSRKHADEVAALPYSTAVKAYIACQMEMDQAVGYLIEQLEAAGIADNTTIALVGDHYPYGLTDAQYEELAGRDLESNFEFYHNNFLLWSGGMEDPIVCDKPCSHLDILPTLSNLMGFEYDSRLLMGTDIFSDSEPLVIFSNRSFITGQGRYNARTGVFTANEGCTVSADYVSQMAQVVNDKFTYSARIIDYNYYSYVFDQ